MARGASAATSAAAECSSARVSVVPQEGHAKPSAVSPSAAATARYRPGAVLMAHGRNRRAESAFEAAIEAVDVAAEKGAEATNRRIVALVRTPVADEDLDELYQCSDVAVAHYAARVVGAKGANAREAS